jgi:hypothetical protein
MKNPKAKGSNFENEIAKDLSLWVAEGKHKRIFMRSNISGALYTNDKKQNNQFQSEKHAGDITWNEIEGTELIDHIYIECKRYKEFNFINFIKNEKYEFSKFWKKCLIESKDLNKIPFMLVKPNYLGFTLLFTDVHGNNILNNIIGLICSVTPLYGENNDSYIYKYDDLINNIKYEDFINKFRGD